MSKVVVALMRFVIALYRRWISPMLGQRCRFHPTCSAYADGCLREHGVLRGSWLAIGRILRCHPFHPGGMDPVPSKLNAHG